MQARLAMRRLLARQRLALLRRCHRCSLLRRWLCHLCLPMLLLRR
jgi:hypothetical protein